MLKGKSGWARLAKTRRALSYPQATRRALQQTQPSASSPDVRWSGPSRSTHHLASFGRSLPCLYADLMSASDRRPFDGSEQSRRVATLLLVERGNHGKFGCIPSKGRMQSVLHRAIELAAECSTMSELKKRLKAEGFANLDSHTLKLGTKRQLRSSSTKARVSATMGIVSLEATLRGDKPSPV